MCLFNIPADEVIRYSKRAHNTSSDARKLPAKALTIPSLIDPLSKDSRKCSNHYRVANENRVVSVLLGLPEELICFALCLSGLSCRYLLCFFGLLFGFFLALSSLSL